MISIRAPGCIGKGGVRGKRCPGTRAESRLGVSRPIHFPRPAGFRAWSYQGPWAGPVG